MSNVIQDITKSFEVNSAFKPVTSIDQLGITIVIGGSCYMASIKLKSPSVLYLRNYSTESEVRAFKDVSFEINDGIYGKIDQWITKSKYGCLDNAGNIYLVSDGEFTKIGATTYNIKKRLNELQTGNAKKLRILGSYKAPRKISVEKILHETYASKRIRGEWFKLDQKDIHEILATKPCPAKLNAHTSLDLDDVKSIEQAITALNISVSEHNSKIEFRKLNAAHEEFLGANGIFWSLNARDRKALKANSKFFSAAA